MLPGKCKLKRSETATHLLAQIQIILKQVSKLYSMLEDDKYYGEKLSCKGDREYQEMGSGANACRVVKEDSMENLG